MLKPFTSDIIVTSFVDSLVLKPPRVVGPSRVHGRWQRNGCAAVDETRRCLTTRDPRQGHQSHPSCLGASLELDLVGCEALLVDVEVSLGDHAVDGLLVDGVTATHTAMNIKNAQQSSLCRSTKLYFCVSLIIIVSALCTLGRPLLWLF